MSDHLQVQSIDLSDWRKLAVLKNSKSLSTYALKSDVGSVNLAVFLTFTQ